MWSSLVIDDGDWHHCALVRDDFANMYLFVDGILQDTGTDTTNWSFATNRPVIGVNDYNENKNYLLGYLDEIRVSKGISRWTSNFTPPNNPADPKRD